MGETGETGEEDVGDPEATLTVVERFEGIDFQPSLFVTRSMVVRTM